MSITKQTSELSTIVDNDRFIIEEMLSEIGELQHVMFVKGFMTVDEIIFAVKKYDVSEVHYIVGTDKAQTMYPVIHKMFYDGKDWKYVYNHEI